MKVSPFQFDRKTLRITNARGTATLEREFVPESEVERILFTGESRLLVNRERNHLDEVASSDLQRFWNEELCSHIAPDEDAQTTDFDRGYLFIADLWSGPDIGSFLILYYHH